MRLFLNLRRIHEIGRVLTKYGFGYVVQRLGYQNYLQLGRRIFSQGRPNGELDEMSRGERVRRALEELGPTFIKFGQVASTRPDIVPQDIVEELCHLQEHVPPFAVSKVWDTLARELRQPPREVFSQFDETPLAAASMAQVHRAVLRETGEVVAVKVRRPNIVRRIERDLSILEHLAGLAERYMPEAELYDPVGLVRQFSRTIRRELDFTREGRTIDEFARHFRDDPTLKLPRVHWPITTESVLTMEFIDGVRVNDLAALQQRDLSSKTVARHGVNIFLKQAFVYGVFHGDPHPGNLRVLEGNVIGLLDFGMVGRLDEEKRVELVDLLIAISQQDIPSVVNLFLTVGEPRAEIDRAQLTTDVTEFVNTYYGVPLEKLEVGNLLRDFLNILVAHRIRYPADTMLLTRALITMEGVGRELDPGFNLAEHLAPFGKQVLQERYSLKNSAKRALREARNVAEALASVPRKLDRAIDRFNRGEVGFTFEHRGLDKLIREMDRSSNRLAVGLVVAALVVASALVLRTTGWQGPGLWFGGGTFLVSFLLGIWLVWGILKSGRL